MTIERERYGGPIIFVCDGCGYPDETHCEEFSGALAKFKSHGGSVMKDRESGDWEHFCRECSR